MAFTIKKAIQAREFDEARQLFQAYADTIADKMCFDSFEIELRDITIQYAAPQGAIFLLYNDGQEPIGCVGIRRLTDEKAEMKRLYVHSSYRGEKLGERLLKAAIEAAKSLSYQSICLDTLPNRMQPAIRLYEKYGFRKIPSYNHRNSEDVLHMKLVF